MTLSPKMKSALIVASGTLLGYLYAHVTEKDRILWMTLGTLAGKFAEDTWVSEPEAIKCP